MTIARLRRFFHRPIRTRRRDRGAVFIEFALVVPVLALLAMGVVEYGLAWNATNDVNSAARDAARVGSSASNYKNADQQIIRQVATGLTSTEVSQIKRVIVYAAAPGSSAVPAACLGVTPSPPGSPSATGVAGKCNVYSQQQVAWVRSNPTSGSNFSTSSPCSSNNWDSKWCPATRNNSLFTNNLDYVGVLIEINHASATHYGFGNQDITRTAVFRLEPAYTG